MGKMFLDEEGSKYRQVKTNIKKWILAGQVGRDGKIPSENSMAELFGISRHTVRQAVGELVNEGWLYREQGRGTFVNKLVSPRAEGAIPERLNIGVITTYLVDYIFPHIISGIESHVTARGHSISLYSTSNNLSLERRVLEQALSQGVHGFIIEPTKSTHPNPNIDLYLLMEQKNIPFVMLHSSYIELNASVVALDDAKGSYLVTNHLFDLGHSVVGAIFKSDDSQGRARFRGFVKAHQDNRRTIEGHFVRTYTTEDQDEIISRYVNDFFRGEGSRPTAVVCYNDEVAVKLINQLQSLGLKVPGDVSVTGFDDSSLALNGLVPLTTVSHPKKKMGEEAAKLLLQLIYDEDNRWIPREHVFQPGLIVRSSTSRPKL